MISSFSLHRFIWTLTGVTFTLVTLLALPCLGSAISTLQGSQASGETKTANSTEAAAQLARRRAACGFNCLYLLLRLSHKEIDTEQLERFLTISDTGNSFLSLKQASQQFGVPGAIVRASASELQQFEMPLILLVDSQVIDELGDVEMGRAAPDFSQVGHYYLLTRASAEHIELIDGTTGECVLLSTADINPNWIQAVFVPSRPFSTGRWLLIALTVSLTLLTVAVYWRYQLVNVWIE